MRGRRLILSFCGSIRRNARRFRSTAKNGSARRRSGTRFRKRFKGPIFAAWFIAAMRRRRRGPSRRRISCGSSNGLARKHSIRLRLRNFLRADGFRLQNGVLRDRAGHVVEFSMVTNAGSKTRERMAAMIQEDLGKLGIKINIVTLDFPSLIERMTRTLNYEACLLGLVNVDPDPSELMNILLSSASNHPWNPSQKTPETAWEAEIDRLMLAQAATADYRERKKKLRPGAGDHARAGAGHLSVASELALGGFEASDWREADGVFSAHLLGRGASYGEAVMLLKLRVSVEYGQKRVLNEVALDVAEGEILGLVGRSGEGKSTIALSILGLLGLKGGRCTGEILFQGRDLLKLNAREMRRLRGKEIALVPQSPLAALNPNVRLGAQLEEAWRAHERGEAGLEASA